LLISVFCVLIRWGERPIGFLNSSLRLPAASAAIEFFGKIAEAVYNRTATSHTPTVDAVRNRISSSTQSVRLRAAPTQWPNGLSIGNGNRSAQAPLLRGQAEASAADRNNARNRNDNNGFRVVVVHASREAGTRNRVS